MKTFPLREKRSSRSTRPTFWKSLLRDYSEPIQPFLALTRTLAGGLEVSSSLFIGGSGEYFRVADLVLVLDSYRPREETNRAKELVKGLDPLESSSSEEALFRVAVEQIWTGPTLRNGPTHPRIKVLDSRRWTVDRAPLELPGSEALRELSQSRFLARLLSFRQRELSGRVRGDRRQSARDLRDSLKEEWSLLGWSGFDRDVRGDLAEVRSEELLAAVRRLRQPPLSKNSWGLKSDERRANRRRRP